MQVEYVETLTNGVLESYNLWKKLTLKDLVDTELRSVQAKKSEQGKRKAKEARRAGLLGADRASTW